MKILTASLFLSIPIFAQSGSQVRQTLDKYCVTCHNQKTQNRVAGAGYHGHRRSSRARRDLGKGGVEAPLGHHASGGHAEARPGYVSYNGFVAGVSSWIRAKPYAGRPLLHRLNRAEYANAIRDLLALDVDAHAAAARRFGLRLRQYLRCAGRFAVAAGAVLIWRR